MLGFVLCGPIAGLLGNRFGRKKVMLFGSVPAAFVSFLQYFAATKNMLYALRLLTGIFFGLINSLVGKKKSINLINFGFNRIFY